MIKVSHVITCWVLLIMSSCQEYYPKPKAILRPEDHTLYMTLDTLPFIRFEIDTKAKISPLKNEEKEIWFNLSYTEYGAQLYNTYTTLSSGGLLSATEDFYKLLQRNTQKEEIHYTLYENKADSIYAHLFISTATAASPIQFFVTDSVKHYFRGALYFVDDTISRETKESYIGVLIGQIRHMLETFKWK